jgi:exopolysaccharide biosynthesis polyprenyl glycosylphosphotransferase
VKDLGISDIVGENTVEVATVRRSAPNEPDWTADERDESDDAASPVRTPPQPRLADTSWFAPSAPSVVSAPPAVVSAPPGIEPPASSATVVLPYVGSQLSERTRGLRAWMVTLPVDLIALLAPLLYTQRFWRGTLFMAGLTLAIFAIGGFYRGRRHMSILDELPGLSGRLLASAAIVAIIAAERHSSVEYVADFMRGVAVSAVLVLLGRAVTRKAVLFARRKRWVEHGALIIGGGPLASELARLLRRYPQYGLRFAGFVDIDASNHTTTELLPLVGKLNDLEAMIAQTDCDVIIIADVEATETELMELVRRPHAMRCDLWVVPRLRDFQHHGGAADHIGAIPVVQLRRPTLDGPKYVVKRCFDILFASVALLILSPILLLCAVATLMEGGRGIFFYQERIGRYGKPFNVIKFRSMRPVNEHESQTNWSVAHDKRVGPVGRFMRRTSLDELPQLWNILRGDMTVVGPRPERPYFVEMFSAEHPNYAMRHRVPVGLTGLAQVSGLRGDTPISDRARFDNYYIENWSLWLDVKVLLRTVAEVFRGGGR